MHTNAAVLVTLMASICTAQTPGTSGNPAMDHAIENLRHNFAKNPPVSRGLTQTPPVKTCSVPLLEIEVRKDLHFTMKEVRVRPIKSPMFVVPPAPACTQ
jgi:hypothetical protein